MKRIVLCILFLFAVAWGWNAAVNCFGPENLLPAEAAVADDRLVQGQDEAIEVLMEANHFTFVSAQLTFNFTSGLARRYRPGGFSFDKFMEYQSYERELSLNNHLKTTLFTSQEYAARQKHAGYYIYSLRRIII